MRNNSGTKFPAILLDARALVNAEPLALENVLTQPWIITFLEMVSAAGAIDRLMVVTLPEFEDRIKHIVRDYPGCTDVDVFVEMPKNIESTLVASVEHMYWRRLFIRTIKRGKLEFGKAVFCSINQHSDLKIAEDFAGRESAGHGTWVLRYIYRPIGYRVGKILSHTSVSPNMVTSTSLLLILIASLFIALDNYLLGLIAALLLNLYMILDVSDGVLARLTRRNSEFGYWFDTVTDTIHDFALIFSFGIGVVISIENSLYFIPVGVWIIGHGATSSSYLISKAAWAKAPTPDPVRKISAQVSGLKYVARFTTRLLMKATGRAEVLSIVYALGLVLDAKIIVLLFFSSVMAFRLGLMFILTYMKSRQNIINSSN